MSQMVYILLPVHNRREVTLRFINCLVAQTYLNYHLVLIDDGSSDGTAEAVREQIESLTVIKGKGNWWWAGSLQHGYEWLKNKNVSHSDVVLIINDDTEFAANFLQNALNVMRGSENLLLLARCFCRESGQLLDAGVHVEWKTLSFSQAETPADINCLSTRGLFIRLSDFFAIGGFYPRLLPHYTSDYEFTMRAHRLGMNLVTDTSCWLNLDQTTTGYHKLAVSSLRNVIWRIFTKKSAENPVVWTAFIVLSCPFRYIPINILRVWYNFSATIYHSVRHTLVNKMQ